MTARTLKSHYNVVVVGGGQAGLSVSAHLREQGVGHVIFEKNRIAHAWRSQRWDAFCLVTPNWQCQLPNFHYAGPDPKGFMPRDEIVAYVEDFAAHIDAPVREGVGVLRVGREGAGGFVVETEAGTVTADAVVMAISAYHKPQVLRVAERLPPIITQLHSSAYRNAAALPAGAIVVVGSGQSGCQIAEDLHLAGRQVHLVVGSAPRCPRFYRGRDAVEWLSDLGQYDMPVDKHPKGEAVRKQANHYLTGRDGGRDIDLRRFAKDGMQLHGRLMDVDGTTLRFGDDLVKNLDNADTVYNGICALIDRHIADSGIDAPAGEPYRPVWQPGATTHTLDIEVAGVSTVIWATGFRSDWSLVDMPLCDQDGYPRHTRGVTPIEGFYVVGMPWLYTWGSGRFLNVGRDAEHIAEHIAGRRATWADARSGVSLAAFEI
ncbi:MSMEG_0569 family flavin-dependent oxidoreductase [Lichenifustis flavocetrariae]|uniref:MSMEG_0569 family flavin-dependent oxidoreductase n=1 Tax=Lichenifustis flavocetrariae TaxID=2949735 RepID=A0AA41Z0W2_9HYPH|nr:MSMEG_0569 family flavin-dependent oxidoreductase [Lichenifustis flavocetrariae]MCW6510916.1 MSMEG_0569 family flavin-dependent oxidoreductase [Lichenifustis flavocetrariae]